MLLHHTLHREPGFMNVSAILLTVETLDAGQAFINLGLG